MGDKTDKGSFDIKFTKLPPALQVRLWTLALDADTSKVNLAYKPGTFVTSLAYNYGGSVEAGLILRRVSTTLGVNPSSGDLNMGLVFRGFKFGMSGNPVNQSAGFRLSYGATVLPFPNELSSSFASAYGGLQNMASDISSAPDNPLAWYKLHSNDKTAISNAIEAGQSIAKYGKEKDRFGFSLRLNYVPQTGLTIYGGAVLRF